MDQLSVTTRAKSDCEILDIATLVAHFTFDTGLFSLDSGPNFLQATTQSTYSLSTGRYLQAVRFDGTTNSYFQVDNLVALGTSNKSFSISFWIRPIALSGVLIHISTDSFGTGWCHPFVGFAANGSLVTQIPTSNGLVSISDPTKSISVNSDWFFIVETWSSTNGLRLFVNNILVASENNLAQSYSASSMSNYLTLGNSRNGVGSCSKGQMGALTPYNGDLDDLRIYSRELSLADICRLFIN